MKTVNVPKQSKSVNALLEQARNESLLVRAADGSEFLLSAVDELDQEIERTRKNKRLTTFLESRARETETVPLEEVKRRLGLKRPSGGGAGRSKQK